MKTLARLVAEGGRLLMTTVSHDNNAELLSLHNGILRERFGLQGSPPTCWRCDSANVVDMVGKAFRDDAMSYYRGLVYFKAAVERGVDGDVLMQSVRDAVAQAFAQLGHFSCNKNTLSLLA